MDPVAELLRRTGHWDGCLVTQSWFATWGFWAVFVAGFSSIPYKVLALAAALYLTLQLR